MPKVREALALCYGGYFNCLTPAASLQAQTRHQHLLLPRPRSRLRDHHIRPASSSRDYARAVRTFKPITSIAASCIVAASIVAWPTNLFLYHPTLAATIAPLATVATIAVRARVEAAKAAPRGQGRNALTRCVKLHFALSALATAAALGSVSAIFVNKIRLGKPHFVSVHAKSGAAALALWLAALFVAETRVWADGLPWWRNGRFDYSPRWVWGSKTHRRLGTAAYVAMLLAIASGVGLTSYGQQLSARTAIIASLGATGITMSI